MSTKTLDNWRIKNHFFDMLLLKEHFNGVATSFAFKTETFMYSYDNMDLLVAIYLQVPC